jgi:pyruvate/2-oxoglutarate dehydrogenase complex dihydrolipoamide acyltransferase (E2) component
MIDVEAESPGILGKILLPDGSTNVPVEKVIALVAKDDKELANLSAHAQAQVPTPPYNHVPLPPSCVAPLPVENKNQPFFSPVLRSPSLFELHTMGDNHHRGMKMKHGHTPSLSIVPPSPQIATSMPSPSVLLSASKVSMFYSRKATENEYSLDNQVRP